MERTLSVCFHWILIWKIYQCFLIAFPFKMSYWWSYLFVWTIPISQLSCKLRWRQTIPRSKPNLTQRPSQLVSRITEGNSIFLFFPHKMLLRDFPANRNVARHWSLRDKSKKQSRVAYLAMELYERLSVSWYQRERSALLLWPWPSHSIMQHLYLHKHV